MSSTNVDVVRRFYQQLGETGDFSDQEVAPEFVLDLSRGAWPEQQTYHGAAGMRQFLAAWLEA